MGDFSRYALTFRDRTPISIRIIPTAGAESRLPVSAFCLLQWFHQAELEEVRIVKEGIGFDLGDRPI
jgi:hypothetical protein